MNIAKISANGQVTVPAEIRRLLDLKSGDKILFFQKPSGEIVIDNASAQAVSMDIPNADTIKAIDDVRHGKNLSRSFLSVEELMEDLNAED